ncbi:hypothetical protein SDC9_126652 [bioreactor metagenome]|uniref:Uncharacterized protein n=1 Tax=bioreactor metagenome TaxID=1076179 RepID=A0A645CRS7_9ZZZZ
MEKANAKPPEEEFEVGCPATVNGHLSIIDEVHIKHFTAAFAKKPKTTVTVKITSFEEE